MRNSDRRHDRLTRHCAPQNAETLCRGSNLSTQNFDRTYFADGQFSRKTNAALQQGVRAILFAALTTNASIAGAQDVAEALGHLPQ